MTEKRTHYCHFCQASESDAGIIIVGPYACICGDCIAKSVEVMAELINKRHAKAAVEPAKQGEGQ